MSAPPRPDWISPGPYAYAPAPTQPPLGVQPAAAPTWMPIGTAVPPPTDRLTTPAPARGSDALPVIALIAAIVAIGVSAIAVVFVLGVQGLGAAGFDDEEGYGGLYALEGSIPGHRSGATVSAEALVASVTEVIEDDGGEVDTLTCPATPRTAQGVVTPCHGTISGDRWAVIVIFDDAAGHYTVVQA